jgi:hypothetical protein
VSTQQDVYSLIPAYYKSSSNFGHFCLSDSRGGPGHHLTIALRLYMVGTQIMFCLRSSTEIFLDLTFLMKNMFSDIQDVAGEKIMSTNSLA